MNQAELITELLNSAAVPDEIKNDAHRLSDFKLGAQAMCQLLSTIFGDDLK